MTSEEFNKSMGAVIREHRKKHGARQVDIAKVLGVTYQNIQKIERGSNGISAHQLTKLAGFFGVSADEMCEACKVITGTTSPAQNDGFLVARNVARIGNDALRSSLVDFTRLS
jgi:transcriptional regulator with XRE-family HTH domain